MLRLQQEDGHLVAPHRVRRAVVAAAAAAGDPLDRQGLDPVGEGGGAGDIGEDAGVQGGGRVADAVLALQQEDGHLLAQGRLSTP